MTAITPTPVEAPDVLDVFAGAKVRAARHAAGLSQEALGARVGVSFQQIQKYERGVNRIAYSTLCRIAGATDQPIRYFFEGRPDALADPGVPEADKAWLASPEGLAWCEMGCRLHRMSQDLLAAMKRLAEVAATRD